MVEEEISEDQEGMQIHLQGNELYTYRSEEIGMYDLLQDNNIYRNKIKVPIIIDFDEVEQL